VSWEISAREFLESYSNLARNVRKKFKGNFPPVQTIQITVYLLMALFMAFESTAALTAMPGF